MLAEHFVASTGVATKGTSANTQKDASILLHEYQPLPQPRAAFKKSATAANCLAVSSSHIFAAQIDKAIVHVYSREKGNQEATVPFPERITCLGLACDDSVLVLGTAEGRVLLWELASGRQITTSQAHLQALTALAIDPTNNFLLSASADSTVHVWSLPALLAFATVHVQSLSPLVTFTAHRAEVVALASGHSSSFCNFAVSVSQDRTCLVWDYHTGKVMRTFLLPGTPTCVAMDAADRYIYVGYEDCSMQQLDLYGILGASESTAPVQPSPKSRWIAEDGTLGAVLSLGVSFDGSTILSGHQSGNVCAWSAGKGRLASKVLQAPLIGSVTNLQFLPVCGFPDEAQSKWKIASITKPKFGAFDNPNGEVPGDYSVNVALETAMPSDAHSVFDEALTASTFPQMLLDEGLAELASWGKQPHQSAEIEEADDFMALEDEADGPAKLTLEEQNAQLKQELDALRRVQKVSFEKMEKMRLEKQALSRGQRRHAAPNGVAQDMNESSDDD